MRALKMFNAPIYSITAEEATVLIEKLEKNIEFKCEERQLYVVIHELDKITAIDNTTGCCFCEEFKILTDAYIWLLELKEAEPLHEVEKNCKAWW